MNDTTRQLHRSTRHKMVAGVAGGLAESFKIDPTLVRLGFVLLSFVGGHGLLLYLILWAILPVNDPAV